jgi:hypothetical protein
MRFSNKRDAFQWKQAPDRLATAKKRLQAPELIFLSTSELTQKEQRLISERHLHLSELAEFTGAGVPLEYYYIYKIT